jgi:hypothetical protein
VAASAFLQDHHEIALGDESSASDVKHLKRKAPALFRRLRLQEVIDGHLKLSLQHMPSSLNDGVYSSFANSSEHHENPLTGAVA